MPWLGAALAAASPVLVLVLIVGKVGAFLASPFGVFFSNETTQDGMLMRQATAELNSAVLMTEFFTTAQAIP